MGKMNIKATACKEYACDRVTLTIRFRADAARSGHATMSALEQCEAFLKQLDQAGIPPQMVSLDDDDCSLDDYRSKNKWKASRKIELRMAYDPGTLNRLLAMLSEPNMNCGVSTSYSNSCEEDIQKELLALAIKQAQERAQLAAAALNCRVTGVSRLNMDPQSMWNSDWMDCESERGFIMYEDAAMEYSNELQAPVKEYSRTVQMTVLTEPLNQN